MRANTSRRGKLAFDDVASIYDAARPRFGEALISQLLSQGGLRTGDAVLEIGAGTGQLTGALLKQGLQVTACEPGPRLAAMLHANFAADTGLSVKNSTFEDMAEEHRFLAIFSANAFHWVDPAVGLPKVRRMLRPGTPLVLIWNYPLLADAELQFPINREVFTDSLESFRRDPVDYQGQVEALGAGGRAELALSGLFDQFDWTISREEVVLSRRAYLDLLTSYANGVGVREALEGRFQNHLPEEAPLRLDNYIYSCFAWTSAEVA